MNSKEKRKEYNRQNYLKNRERNLQKAKQYYQNNKAARRAYHKQYYADHWEQENNRMKTERKRKSIFRDTIALHYGCRNPGCCWKGPFDPCQLDFHHFDQKEKSGQLGQMRTVCMEKFIAEINKCIVLCRCCHPFYHKGGFQLDESLKCNVDPITYLPRTPNTGAENVGIRVNP